MIELNAEESLKPKTRWQTKLVVVVGMVVLMLVLIVGFLLLPDRLFSQSLIPTESGLVACNVEDLDELYIKTDRTWHLLGKEFESTLPLNITFGYTPLLECDPSSLTTKIEIPGQVVVTYPLEEGVTEYRHELDYSSLDAGNYDLIITVSEEEEKEESLFDPEQTREASTKISLSYPVYVAWTLDWEGYNFSNSHLDMIQALTNRKQNVPITHFFNPAYYTSTNVSDARADELLAWIKNRVNTHDDVIGMHLHMFYYMVEAFGIEPLEEPTWASRGTGSDVPMTSYTAEEQAKMIELGTNLLKSKGIEEITAFRAGGWFANESTMQALEDYDYTMESSGRTYYSLGNNLVGPWSLPETQQPYYMCRSDQNAECDGAAAFNILQIPNNGGESYRFTANQLVDRFTANYKSGVAENLIVVTYLSHPEWFYIDNPKIDKLFNHIDNFAYAADNGPVIYTNLETIEQSWISNQY